MIIDINLVRRDREPRHRLRIRRAGITIDLFASASRPKRVSGFARAIRSLHTPQRSRNTPA